MLANGQHVSASLQTNNALIKSTYITACTEVSRKHERSGSQ